MRPQEQIVKRIERKQKEVMSFEPEVLMLYLDFEHAKPMLKPEATEKDWNGCHTPYTRENVLKEAETYMREYGWAECQEHRGISAERTIMKMTAWAWLLEEDDLLQKMKDTEYQNYGAPKLKVVCEHFGWPIPNDEPTQRMMGGQMCRVDCS